MVRWVDVEGTVIGSGAVNPGSLQSFTSSSGLIITVVAGDSQNTITFSAVSGADSYNIYWSTSPGVTTGSNVLTGVTSPYIHTSLTNGTVYYYAYTAVTSGVEGVLSNEVSGTPTVPGQDAYPILYATYSNDVTTAGFGNWSGHSIGPQDVNYRAFISFDISIVPVGATIDSLQLETTSYWVSGNGSDDYFVGPYNGDGIGDPLSDGYATAYSRCSIQSDYYLGSITDYRSTGTITVTLGAQAITDLLAARAASETTFTIALQQHIETGTSHYATFEGWTAGNDAPKLRVNNLAPTQNVNKVLFALRA